MLNSHLQNMLVGGRLANTAQGKDYEASYGTADYTVTSFPTTVVGSSSSTDVIVAVDANISSTDDGVLFEFGGSGGAGMSAGVNNGTLRCRAFDSAGDSAFSSGAGQAHVEVSISSYTGSDATYYFVVDFSADTLTVFAQAGGVGSLSAIVELGSDTADGSSTIVYGSNAIGYGTVNGTIADLGSAYEVNFNGTIDEVRVWTGDATLDASGFGDSFTSVAGSGLQALGFIVQQASISPSYVGSTSVNDASSLSLTGITGLQEGDVVVFFAADDNNADAGQVSSSGWTELWYSNQDIVSTGAIKTMGATVDSSVAINQTMEVLLAIAFRNVTASDYVLSTESISSSQTESSFCPSITVAVDNSVVILFAAIDDEQGSTVNSIPSGYTLAVEEQGAVKESGALLYKTGVSAGTNDSVTVGWSRSDTTLGRVLALKPAFVARNSVGFTSS